MRGSRGYGGRDIRKVVHFPETSKPQPIVPKRLIRGVSERVDCFGEIIVQLNEKEAETAIRELLAEGVQAIAICFLWSFRNPAHEQRVKALVEGISKDIFVTCSVDIAPKWGSTSASPPPLNAYLGPVMSGYLYRLNIPWKIWIQTWIADRPVPATAHVPVARAGDRC
jgi:N-methylhydantoinase A